MGDVELVAASRTLDLKLSKRDPGKGRQNLHRLPAPRLPGEVLVVSARPAGERLLLSRHQKLSVADQRLLQKVGQKLRQQDRKGRQQGRQSDIQYLHFELTVKSNREIFFLWGSLL